MSQNARKPLIPASQKLPEITFKAVILSILLAVILAASNTYLALKIGTTISASIPAAVIAIGVLRLFRRHNVLECNIVQTAASAGEAVAASSSFVLPAFLIVHFWMGFHYWETTIVVGLGGVLGVAFSVPLRRVLLDMPLLPFPEGFAVGETLKVSTQGGNLLRYLLQGIGVSTFIGFLQNGLEVISGIFTVWRVTAGNILYGMSLGCMPAALAAGYIVGVRVAIALLVGIIFGWILGIPVLSHFYGVPAATSTYDAAMMIWKTHLRYVGVGVMLVGGVWTLLRLFKPVGKSLALAWLMVLKKTQATSLVVSRTEQDVPLTWIIGFTIVISAILYYELLHLMFSAQLTTSTHLMFWIGVAAILYIVIVGFLLSTMCGYFAGLIGSTNNPLSGLAIMSILLIGLIFNIFFMSTANPLDAAKVVALVILMTVIVASIASVSNDCMQDLKAGKMVGATPWKQQIMLIIGVLVAASVVAPVLELLFHAYGMGGIFPRAHMSPAQMLPAPQGMLMASVAQGVIQHNLDWTMIISGIIFGILALIVDESIANFGYRLPVLAIGLGIYLPPELMTPFVIGGFVSYFAKRKVRNLAPVEQERREQKAILIACGIVAGGSLMGVILAIPFVMMGSSDALAIAGSSFAPVADVLGALVVIGLCYWLYRASIEKNA